MHPLLSIVTRVTYINRRLQAQYIARQSFEGSMAELRVSEVETNLHTILVAPPVIRARAQKPDQIVMWVLTDALSR